MMSEEKQAPLALKVSQNQVKNAVRDIVRDILIPEQAKIFFDDHLHKEKERLTKHVSACCDHIQVPTDMVNRRILQAIERGFDQKMRECVERLVTKMVTEQVEICVKHIVSTGVTVEIGGAWRPKVTIKTEEKKDE